MPSTRPRSFARVLFRSSSAIMSFWNISRADAASAIRVSGALPSSLMVSSGSWARFPYMVVFSSSELASLRSL
ncbi:MAG: hypothetical protein ACK55Z_09645 [bacterium]